MISVHSTGQKKSERSSTIVYVATQTLLFPFKFFLFWMTRIAYYFLYKYGIIPKPLPTETITTLSSTYIQNQTTKFLESYNQKDQSSWNENIEKCFYDSKSHSIETESENNELEKTWKRRILFENTPRGNVIMYYDAFKQGFIYYSDNSTIPYFLLNAVVMKYVLLYRCRDFFIDSQITPQNARSPLLDIYNKPDKTLTVPSSTETKPPPLLKSSAFVKLKSYNSISGKISSPEEHSNTTKNIGEENSNKYIRNKIIHLGKISNFHFLQRSKKIPHVHVSSIVLDSLATNCHPQKNVFSYKEFKKLREQPTNEPIDSM